MNNFTTPIFNYCKALYEHDWTFEYSEDQRAWQVGRAQRQELELLQPRFDPDFTIWNKFAPSDFRRKAQAPAEAHGSERDAQEQPFEDWWEHEGQFGRAGGGQYEKTFAWNAWCAASKAQPKGTDAALERMRHIANEWADMATNGTQWLRNIRDGISTVDEALAHMAKNYEHCRKVNDAPGLYGSDDMPAPAPAQHKENPDG